MTVSRNKLQVSLVKLKEGRQNFHQSLTADELDLTQILDCRQDRLKFIGPIVIDAELFKNGDTVVVSGKINFRTELCCVNCLEKYEQDFSQEIYQEYVKIAKPMSYEMPQRHREHRENPARYGSPFNPVKRKDVDTARLEDIDFVREFYTTGFFDLTLLVYDTILLAMPIANWCREDCSGVSA